jgi:hypothetical protein
MLRNTAAALLAVPAIMIGAADARALPMFLDFEGDANYTPIDNQVVAANTFDAYFVRFVPGQTGLAFEASGGEDDAPHGFVNDPESTLDTERADAADELGTFFLRQTDSLGSAQNFDSTNAIFSIDYLKTATGVISGEIWDIDGNGGQGTEQWEVVASFGGSTLGTLLSPLGTTTNDGANPFQAGPWNFSFDAGTFATGIDRLDFFFKGSKTEGIGVAFDNFKTGVVPVPAALPMLLSGIGLLGFFARRRA